MKFGTTRCARTSSTNAEQMALVKTPWKAVLFRHSLDEPFGKVSSLPHYRPGFHRAASTIDQRCMSQPMRMIHRSPARTK